MSTRWRVAAAALLMISMGMLWWRPDLIGRVVGPCLFRDLSGHPCFTCGTTRALSALSHGELATALKANPLAVAATFGIAVWLIRPIRPRRWRWWLAAAMALATANWVYLLLLT